MNEPKKDPPIDEIRAIRSAISERAGHDPKRLVEYYIQLQQNHADRLIDPPPLRKPEATAG